MLLEYFIHKALSARVFHENSSPGMVHFIQRRHSLSGKENSKFRIFVIMDWISNLGDNEIDSQENQVSEIRLVY